jgi:hypothetical protein
VRLLGAEEEKDTQLFLPHEHTTQTARIQSDALSSPAARLSRNRARARAPSNNSNSNDKRKRKLLLLLLLVRRSETKRETTTTGFAFAPADIDARGGFEVMTPLTRMIRTCARC